jgi:general transcription factor 3C polypeptide 5 (transcription factor C subunit 1)
MSTNNEEKGDVSFKLADTKLMPQTVLTVVHFPLIVKHDPQKALQMIGGENAVTKVSNDESKFLELRFRPNDPMSHPTHGDHTKTNNLLLRVRRKRDPITRKFTIENVDLIGKVKHSIQFRGMVDFQLLQPKVQLATARDKPTIKKEEDVDMENEVNVQDLSSSFIEKEFTTETLNLPPPIFSRFDIPQEYTFRANPASATVVIQTDEGTITKRKLKKSAVRPTKSITIDFATEIVPSKPAAPTVESSEASTSDTLRVEEDEYVIRLKQMFESRPIWSKTALRAQFESRQDITQTLSKLPLVAYSFSNGPWRKLWVRFGLDPRLDRSCGQYQVLDFRVQNEHKEYVKERKKQKGLATESEVFGGVNVLRRQPKRRSQLHDDLRTFMATGTAQHEENDNEQINPNSSYIFNSVPVQTQFFYQLIDIHLPAVQHIVQCDDLEQEVPIEIEDRNGHIVNKNIRVLNHVCDEKSGWYTREALEQIRMYMKIQISEWIRQGDEGEDEDETENTSDK